jgi:hypothetical protein
MQIRKDGAVVYNSIDNTGSTDDASLGARYAMGRLDTLDGRFDGYYTKTEVLDLLTGVAPTKIVSALPASPDANTYYMVGNDTDGYVLHYYDSDSNHALVGSYDIDLSSASPQKAVLPDASADYEGKVWQYIGDTQVRYTYGMFYTCRHRQYFAWLNPSATTMYTYSATPSVGDTIYDENGVRYAYKVKEVTSTTVTDENLGTWTRNAVADTSRYQWEPMYVSEQVRDIASGTRVGNFDLSTGQSWSMTTEKLFKWMTAKMFPVGSLYVTTNSINPATTLGIGTWEIVATNRALWGVAAATDAGTTIDEELPNVKGDLDFSSGAQGHPEISASGAFKATNVSATYPQPASTSGGGRKINFNAARSNSIYKDNAHVQPNAYTVHIWKRTA